jgi:hypothetical protein
MIKVALATISITTNSLTHMIPRTQMSSDAGIFAECGHANGVMIAP